MDAFFASVEQRDHPHLKGQPVAVGGSPNGRGVVAAASYEARKFGVKSAMPSWRALKLCPDLVFVKSRFDVYKQVSEQIREIFYEYTDLVEPLSLDEAYLDITDNKLQISSARQVALEIKQKIQTRTGLTASAGVATNKFVAKIASDINKPNGIAVITPEKMVTFLEELPIGKFHGIGKATEQKMQLLGIFTGKDLKGWEEHDLVREFGKSGSFFYKIVRGDDDRPVQPNRIRKSVGAENTFSNDLESVDDMKSELKRIAEKVSTRMNRINTKGRTVTVKVRYDDFESVTRSHTLNEMVNSPDILYDESEKLLSATEAGIRKVRLLGISVSNLDNEKREDGQQLELKFKQMG